MHKHFPTQHLSLEERRDLLRRAHAICQRWWVDILDCRQSFCRQVIEMPFDEALQKLDQQAHFSVIHRNLDPENYLEIGFRTSGPPHEPDYFLWIIVGMEHLKELGLE